MRAVKATNGGSEALKRMSNAYSQAEVGQKRKVEADAQKLSFATAAAYYANLVNR